MKRKLSLLLAFVAFIAVPLWAYYQGEADAVTQVKARGWACGMPILGLYLFSLLVSGALSAASLAFGALAYRALPQPRSRLRMLELLLISAPLLLAITVMAALFLAGA